MDAQDAFRKFMDESTTPASKDVALAFFVGYSHGATGARENVDAIIAAFNKYYRAKSWPGPVEMPGLS